jgi:hypothetical protein
MAVIKLPQSSIQGSGFSEGISLMEEKYFERIHHELHPIDQSSGT